MPFPLMSTKWLGAVELASADRRRSRPASGRRRWNRRTARRRRARPPQSPRSTRRSAGPRSARSRDRGTGSAAAPGSTGLKRRQRRAVGAAHVVRRLPGLVQRPSRKFDCCPRRTSMCCSTQNRSGIARKPPPSGELAGVGVPAVNMDVAVAGADELARRADGGQHGDRASRAPSVASDVVDQLVDVVGERVLRVGALVQLGQHVALDREDGRAGAPELELDVVLPTRPCGRRGPRPADWPGSEMASISLATPNGRPPVSS